MVLAVVFFLFHNAIYKVEQNKNFGKTDYTIFYIAGATITHGINLVPDGLYIKHLFKPQLRKIKNFSGGTQFLYPPVSALFFAPFSLFTYAHAYKLWAWCNVLGFILAYYLSVLVFIGSESIFKLRFSLLLFLLSFSPVVSNGFGSGQVNSLIWLCLMLGFFFSYSKKKSWGGVAFALPALIKIFSVIFFIPLLIRKRWWDVLWGGVAALSLIVFSLVFFHWDSYVNYWQHILPGLGRGDVGSIIKSTSLFGNFRLSVQHGWFDWTQLTRKRVVVQGRHIHQVLTFLVAGLMMLVIFIHRKLEDKISAVYDYSLCMLFVLVMSISTHQEWLIWTIPLLIFLLSFPFNKRSIPLWLAGITAVFIFFFRNIFSLHIGGIDLQPHVVSLTLLILFFFCYIGRCRFLQSYYSSASKT